MHTTDEEKALRDDEWSPLPLVSAQSEAARYPTAALGPLATVTKELASGLQIPIEQVAQTVLAVTSLAIQGRIDVKTPIGLIYPLSLYMITVVGPGSRSNLLDKIVFSSVRKVEAKRKNKLTEYYSIQNSDDNELNCRDKERKELGCYSITSDFLPEELFRNFEYLPKSLIYTSNNAGQLFGSVSGKSKQAPKFSAYLEKLWDGENVFLTHGTTAQVVQGKRLTIAAVVDEKFAPDVLNVERSTAPNLLARSLVAWPESLVGKRVIGDFDPAAVDSLREFNERISNLLSEDTHRSSLEDSISPRDLLVYSPNAAKKLREFTQNVEKHLNSDSYFGSIAAFASNAGEHISKIAGLLSIYEDPATFEISENNLNNALLLFRYYSTELRRMQEKIKIDEEISNASLLLSWLKEQSIKRFNKGEPEFIPYRFILQYAHPKLRLKSRLDNALGILEDHRWIDWKNRRAFADGNYIILRERQD